MVIVGVKANTVTNIKVDLDPAQRTDTGGGLDQDPVKTVERGEEVHPTGSTARVVIKHQ